MPDLAGSAARGAPRAVRDGELTGRRILVVEDDETLAEVISRYLIGDGAHVRVVGDGVSALTVANTWRPDLVVLDVMLPALDGWEVCRRLQHANAVPVVMVSALGDAEHRLVGLDIGADDYLCKPFSTRELVARIRAVLRRVHGERASSQEPVEIGDLVVDPAARRVTRAGEDVRLTAREFDLLLFLMQNVGVAFARGDLLERVWGYRHGDRSTVTVYVRRLREKLEEDPADPQLIRTVWRVGYRLDAPAP